MNFKKIGLGLAATAAMATGVMVTGAPADAAIVKAGDVLNFGGSAQLGSETDSFTTLTFADNEAVVTKPSSSVFGVAAPPFKDATAFTIGNLSLERTSATTWKLVPTSVPNWLTGLANNVQYTLESFNLTKTGNIFSANYTGFFTPPTSGTPGLGGLTSQGSFSITDGSSFSSTITAVPTPALLPGLLGIGAAALRKKRKEGEAEEALETAEVRG
jgi:hypothetical protein